MWTADNRPRYNRDKLRYPSDLTDADFIGEHRCPECASSRQVNRKLSISRSCSPRIAEW